MFKVKLEQTANQWDVVILFCSIAVAFHHLTCHLTGSHAAASPPPMNYEKCGCMKTSPCRLQYFQSLFWGSAKIEIGIFTNALSVCLPVCPFRTFSGVFPWLNQQRWNRLQEKKSKQKKRPTVAKVGFRKSKKWLLRSLVSSWSSERVEPLKEQLRLSSNEDSVVYTQPLSSSQCVCVCVSVCARTRTPTVHSITQPCDSFSGQRH